MKAKKLLAVLLSFAMAFSATPAFSVVASAEGGHVHTEECYDESGERICGFYDDQISLAGLEWHGEVVTAQDLKDAVSNSAAGETIVLGAEIDYSQSELDSIVVDKNVRLDFNGHKITVDDALFEIAETGSLTLVNAQIESTGDDVIDTIKAGGVLTIESTAGDGIVSSDDVISDNYGTVVVKGGSYKPGYSLIYENYGNASVIIENANVVSEDYIVGYLEDDGCSLEIKSGYYESEHIISGLYAGNAVIETGTFISSEDCVDDFTGGVLTVKGGTFTAGNAENEAICFDISDNGALKIEDGDFASTYYAIWAINEATVQLSGGTFTNSSGGAAFQWENENNISIAEGYVADPADWRVSSASKIRICPDEFDIVFLDENGAEDYRETVKANSSVVNWPSRPEAPSKEYRWWGWVDADGNRYDSDSVFTSATELQAKFVKEGLPMDPDPEEPDTPSTPEKPSGEPSVVTSYEELKSAIDAKKSYIRISGNVEFPSEYGALNVASDVYITADEGTKITGPGNMFQLASGVELTFDGVDVSTDSNKVVYMYSDSVCNIVSGNYSAPDDAISGGSSSTVNLFGGRIEERTGNDGPIYKASIVYMNHTKDGNGSDQVIEVVPSEEFTVIFYDGDEILKTVQAYETELLCLPEICSDDFLGWFDADGNQYFTGFVESNLTLYASYKKDTVTVTFIVDGAEHKSVIPYGAALSTAENFSLAQAWQDKDGLAWISSSVVEKDTVLYPVENDSIVRTLDELKAAIASSSKSIVIGAEIPVTETVVVNRSVSISSVDGGSLVRPDGFTETLLSVESTGETPTQVTIGNLLIDGRNVEAEAAAISVDSASSLVLKGTTIKSNWNMNDNWWEECGGAVYSKGKVYIYEGTTLCSNKSYIGGAIDIDCEDETACLYLYGGDICHNSAWCTSGCEGAGGGVHIGDNEVEDNVAFYMYGGRIHHNRAESSESGDYDTCDGGGVSLTCGDDGIHFAMYGGSITDNFATGNGGGVYTACSSMTMYGGVIARNVAEKNGGAVSTDCCDNTFYMYGGTITLNAAGENGGGVDTTGGYPYTLLGNVYGNLAGTSGDDVYASDDNNGSTLRKVNDAVLCENPYYISGGMQELYNALAPIRPGYMILSPIEGYDFTLSMPEKIQHIGWFEDMEDDRYVEGNLFIPTTNKSDGTSFELQSGQDVKAVYGEFLLVYDANYGSGEYQYDDTAYGYGSKAATANCMFNRDGYKFIGWNSKADGSGLWYYPDLNGYNSVIMDANKVVYAQWEKVYSVKYEVAGDKVYGSPTDVAVPTDDNWYAYEDTVTVSPNLTTAWKTSDGTADGVPGTWSFTSWDKEDDFLIASDTVIRGAWSFTPSSDGKDDGKDDGSTNPTNSDDSKDDSNSSTNPTKSINLPQTGDDLNIGLWLSLMLVSLAAIFGGIYKKKRRDAGNHERRDNNLVR